MIRSVLARGLQTYLRHWGALVAASGAVLLVSLPIGFFAGVTSRAMEQIVAASQHEGAPNRNADPAREIARLLAPCLPCCGGLLGDALLTMLIFVPLVAGACAVGAHAAAGRPAVSHLWDGFRRYLSVVMVGTLCLLLGGGVAFVAGGVASLGALGGVVAAVNASEKTYGKYGMILLWVCVALIPICATWLSARLWLSLYRATDLARPRIGVVRTLSWSWHATSGPTQWRVVVLLVVIATIAGALQIPGDWLATLEAGPGPWMIWGLQTGVALLVWLPLALATSGALYEELAVLGDRVPPPPPVPGV